MDEQTVELVEMGQVDEANEKAAGQAKKVKKTKPPTRKVYADDLVVTVDGEEYHPHAGEYVVFRGKLRLDTLVAAMKLSSIGKMDMSDVTMEEAEALEETASDLYKDLQRGIQDWDWTDDDGTPYRSPPTKAELSDVGFDEVMWLVGASFGGMQGPEDRVKD